MDVTSTSWRKSSYSGNNGGACIEVAATDHVLVRDTQDREGPTLGFGRQAWKTFATKLKAET